MKDQSFYCPVCGLELTGCDNGDTHKLKGKAWDYYSCNYRVSHESPPQTEFKRNSALMVNLSARKNKLNSRIRKLKHRNSELEIIANPE